MACEIELKAHVDDVSSVRAALEGMASFCCEFVKEDDYWFPGPEAFTPLNSRAGTLPESGVRVRKEKTAGRDGGSSFCLVTYKTKERRSNIEVNRENEFVIKSCGGESDEEAVAAFEGLLSRAGLERGFSKKKEGVCYKYGEVSAELTLVDRLGWFLELEVISRNDDEETVARIKDTLTDFLKKAGLGEEMIEPRYYSEMLKDAGCPGGASR